MSGEPGPSPPAGAARGAGRDDTPAIAPRAHHGDYSQGLGSLCSVLFVVHVHTHHGNGKMKALSLSRLYATVQNLTALQHIQLPYIFSLSVRHASVCSSVTLPRAGSVHANLVDRCAQQRNSTNARAS